MHLYFLRHGKAEDHDLDKPDRERHLIERGVADANAIAGLLKMQAVTFAAIFTSPYPRAAETARIVSETLGLPHVLTERVELEAGRFNLGSVQKLAPGHGADTNLLFVGHEPDLSHVIELLTGAACEMKTASLAHVTIERIEPEHGILRSLVPPKLLHSPT